MSGIIGAIEKNMIPLIRKPKGRVAVFSWRIWYNIRVLHNGTLGACPHLCVNIHVIAVFGRASYYLYGDVATDSEASWNGMGSIVAEL